MLRIAILSVSNSIYSRKKENISANLLAEQLRKEMECSIVIRVLPDDQMRVVEEMIELIDRDQVDLLLTTGGVGVRPEDITPEATERVIQRSIPGMAEEIRRQLEKKYPHSLLIRVKAGMRKQTLVINFPGLPNEALDGYKAISDQIPYAISTLQGNRKRFHLLA